MVYVKYVIREMFQKTYVIRDLNENRLVIRDREPPLPPCLLFVKIMVLTYKHVNILTGLFAFHSR